MQAFAERLDRSGTGSLKWQKYAGRDILPMWVADMDFRAPTAVEVALAERVAHGVFGYTVPYPSVVEAVLAYLQQVHGQTVEPDWLVWMPGLVPALNTAARAFEERGDAVLTNTPVYPPFLSAPGWQDKQLISVPLQADARGAYGFDWEAMEAAVTPQTRLFILCNPHNPVGRVYRREELQAVVAFCERHGLILISDEIHCDLILEKGLRHQTALGLGDWAREHSLTLMAPSKTYNIPGLSCSFIVIPNARLRAQFQRASRGMITEVNCMGYVACEAAYRHGGPWLEALLETLRANYRRLVDFVATRMPLVRLTPLEATYLAWLDVRALGLAQPCQHFEAHGVGLSDGAQFGQGGYLRLNFGCPAAQLEAALERIERGYHAAL